MPLLVRAVARANQRPGEDGAEPEALSLLAEPAELVGVDPAIDLRVLRARLQVLADRDHVDAIAAEVAHRLDYLVVRLPHAEDDSGLRQDRVVRELLRPGEQPERLVVARLRPAHARVQAADR